LGRLAREDAEPGNHMDRYAVIDTESDDGSEQLAGWTGIVLGHFDSIEGAKGLVLHRLSLGDKGVVAIALPSGERVYPPERSLYPNYEIPTPIPPSGK
jgi:hypothetical protein